MPLYREKGYLSGDQWDGFLELYKVAPDNGRQYLLDSINWMAVENGQFEISQMLKYLGDLFRYSVRSSEIIEIKTEISHLRQYVYLQQRRYAYGFVCRIKVEKEVETCHIHKLLLQPLVENAIIHGLDGCANGYICIYAAQKDGILRISVTDDGCGMGQEMLDWMNSPNPAKRDGHLGLYNVIQILKLYYGEEYGIQAESDTSGTTVTIRLPAKKEAPHV